MKSCILMVAVLATGSAQAWNCAHERNLDATLDLADAQTLTVRAAAGDLHLEVVVRTHPVFRREGNDLFVTRRIPFSDVCLGTSIDVPTLDGSKRVKVPAGMQTGGKIRLKGLGVPGKGDLYAVIEVDVPKALNAEQKKLLEKLRDTGL